MAPKPVKLTFAGDSTQLERTFDRVGGGAKAMASDLDSASSEARRFGSALDGAGNVSDKAEGKFMGTADVLDGLGGIMGINTGAATGMMRAWGDLSGGFAQIQPMISGVAGAMQGGLKSALTMIQTHPVLFTVGLLATAFVTLWMNSETFRDIVTRVFQSVKQVAGDAIGFILDYFEMFLGAVASVAETAGRLPLVGDKFDGIAEKVRGAQHRIGEMSDSMHALGEEANVVAGIFERINKGGGGGLGNILATINVGKRAAGGPVTAGSPYLVGEQGPELFVPGAGGGTIVPNGAGTQRFVVQLVLDGNVVTEVVHDGLLAKQRTAGNLGFEAA